MSISKDFITVELADGTIIKDVRVTIPDRLRMEEVGKVNGWKVGQADSPHFQTQQVFLAYAALSRTGQYSGKFEDFRTKDCLDIDLRTEAADATDPTRTEATTV